MKVILKLPFYIFIHNLTANQHRKKKSLFSRISTMMILEETSEHMFLCKILFYVLLINHFIKQFNTKYP